MTQKNIPEFVNEKDVAVIVRLFSNYDKKGDSDLLVPAEYQEELVKRIELFLQEKLKIDEEPAEMTEETNAAETKIIQDMNSQFGNLNDKDDWYYSCNMGEQCLDNPHILSFAKKTRERMIRTVINSIEWSMNGWW